MVGASSRESPTVSRRNGLRARGLDRAAGGRAHPQVRSPLSQADRDDQSESAEISVADGGTMSWDATAADGLLT